jgi:hypothetical protein
MSLLLFVFCVNADIQRLIEDRSQVLSIPTAVRAELLTAVQVHAIKHSANDTTPDDVHATATAVALQVRLYQSYE